MDNILLHVCCAPCALYPVEQLRKNNFTVTQFFYNPNIHPVGEYENRKNAVKQLSLDMQLETEYPLYKPEEFFREVNLNETAPERCARCFRLRLKKTASVAKEKGYRYFTTTLLVSPYQDQELLKNIGVSVAEEAGLSFYYEDFRPGFRQAHAQAKAKGIYCQKYCGCIYSEIERCRQSVKR